MNTPAPGDRVDVTIRDAVVTSVEEEENWITVEYDTADHRHYFDVRTDAPGVTVTPHADGGAEGLDDEAIRATARGVVTIDMAPSDVPDAVVDALAHVGYLRAAAGHLDAGRAAEEVARLRALIADLVSDEECQFDHHGGCQEHGYLSLEPGQKCPHQEAKEILAENGAAQ